MISVLMLTLHKSAYLPFAVASVMEYRNAELILISPSETDLSRELIPKLKSLYGERIRCINKTDNSPGEGLNNGLLEVHGDIVGVLNGDDFYLPGGLNAVVNAFDSNPDLDLLLGGGLIVDQNGNSVKHVIPGNIKYARIFNESRGAFTFLHQSMFYRFDKYRKLKFNESNIKNWDTEFLLQFLALSPNILESKKTISAFRITSENISSQIQGAKKNQLNSNSSAKKKLNKDFFIALIATWLRICKLVKLIAWVIKCQLSREGYRR